MIKPIHAIDQENALLTTAKRAEKLREVKEKLLAKHQITRDVLAEYLPSISSIKAVTSFPYFPKYTVRQQGGRVSHSQLLCRIQAPLLIETGELASIFSVKEK